MSLFRHLELRLTPPHRAHATSCSFCSSGPRIASSTISFISAMRSSLRCVRDCCRYSCCSDVRMKWKSHYASDRCLATTAWLPSGGASICGASIRFSTPAWNRKELTAWEAKKPSVMQKSTALNGRAYS